MAAAEEEALSTLSAIFPDHSKSLLSKFLAASSNNVERATNAILRGNQAIHKSTSSSSSSSSSAPKRRKLDSGLKTWLNKDGDTTTTTTTTSPQALKQKRDSAQAKPVASTSDARPLKSAFSLLKAQPASKPSTPAPAPSLPPITLTTPQQVFEATGGLCTLIPDVLPKDLSARLFLRMVNDSLGIGREDQKGWDKNRWYLFDREVVSPHTTQFYAERPQEVGEHGEKQAPYNVEEAAKYWYNGEKRESRTFNEEMNEAREVIRPLVRTILAARKRHSLEFEGEWTPNVAAANCYRGSKESVGWHSDALTYLGPFPTIASLSLGCTRPFRLRAQVTPPPPGSPPVPPPRTLSIPLPHGSLIIMHAGCQEKFKHCVPEVGVVDLFRLPKGLGTELEGKYGEGVMSRGFKERINMTFRFYRPDFAPLASSDQSPSEAHPSTYAPQPSSYPGTPHCKCGVPCVLRPDARGKVKARLNPAPSHQEDEEELLFFWSCAAGAQNEGKTCGLWKVLDMKVEKRGKWFGS